MNGTRIHVRGAELDLVEDRIRAPDGTLTELRQQSADVLRVLAARRGETVSKDELHAAVWGDVAVTEDSLVQCIGDIRRALGDARDALQTVPKRGYRLEAEPATAARWPRRTVALAAGLVAVALLGLALVVRNVPATRPLAGSGAEGPVVAVLPFASLSGGARWDRLAQALTEDVIADLSQHPRLVVLASAATRGLVDASPQEIGADLGVQHLVTGSVPAEGERVLVAAALIAAETGRQVWSRRFEGAAGDLLVMQAQASEALAGELGAIWTGAIAAATKAEARGRGTRDLAAYELALLGSERMQTYTREGIADAIDLFERAVRKDPGFGEAWAYLAFAHYNGIMPDMSPEEQAAAKAARDAAAHEGYRVSPNLPKPMIQAAEVMAPSDPAAALRLYRRAAELVRGDGPMLAYLAGKAPQVPAMAPEAQDWLDRARALPPGNDHYWPQANVFLAQGRYAEAAENYALAEDYVDVHMLRAACLALAGQLDAARALMADTLAENPLFTNRWFGDILLWDPDVESAVARGLRLAGAPG